VEANRALIAAKTLGTAVRDRINLEEGEDAAWTNLCVAVDGWTPDAQGSDTPKASPEGGSNPPPVTPVLPQGSAGEAPALEGAARYLREATEPLILEPGTVYHEFYHDPEGSIPGAYHANFYLWCIKKALSAISQGSPARSAPEGGSHG
jgi:hypothetical protein